MAVEGENMSDMSFEDDDEEMDDDDEPSTKKPKV